MPIPGTVPFTGLIAPTATSDTYPITDPVYGVDGLRSVADTTERDAISAQRRREGMLVYTQDDGKYWRLEADLTTWTEFATGGGGSPGGVDREVQFNDGGTFGGASALIYRSDLLSFAEGSSTASGSHSHAEGTTTASGQLSHAEGDLSIASGYASHAEGSGLTQALGQGSHAECGGAVALGNFAHAEGDLTKAAGNFSHSEGREGHAGMVGLACTISGTTVTVAGGDFTGMFTTDIEDTAFYSLTGGSEVITNAVATASSVVFSSPNTIITLSAPITTDHTSGLVISKDKVHSCHSEGFECVAQATSAHAEGNTTTASGVASHAEGQNTIAYGDHSHAQGLDTTALSTFAHAEGSGTVAGGKLFPAIISGTTVTIEGGDFTNLFNTGTERLLIVRPVGGPPGAMVITKRDVTNVVFSTPNTVITVSTTLAPWTSAKVIDSTNITDHCHAEGDLSVAAGYTSHAEGLLGQALGDYSHAEGSESEAVGDYSHVEGGGGMTGENADYAHCEGANCSVAGAYAHAEGNFCNATGSYSHAEGSMTVAEADYTHSEGSQTTAIGYYCHAEGNGAMAGGRLFNATISGTTVTIAGGNFTEFFANGGNLLVIHPNVEGGLAGRIRTSTSRTMTSVTFSSPNTVITVDVSLAPNTSAQVIDSSTAKDAAHAEGLETIASGENSHAEGFRCVASGFAAHAEGGECVAAADYSHAEGSDCIASNFYSHVGGASCKVEGMYSLAHGQAVSILGFDASYNLLTGSGNGLCGAYSMVGGSGNMCTGSYSLACGSTCWVADDYSFACGSACAVGSVAYDCTVSGGGLTLTITQTGDFTSLFNSDLLVFNLNTGVDKQFAEVDATALVGSNTVITLSQPLVGTPTAGRVLPTVSYGISAMATGAGSLATEFAQHAQGNGGFDGVNGSSQTSSLVVSGESTSATPVALNPIQYDIAVRRNHTYSFTLHLVGRKTDGTKHASFIRQGLISNEAGTTALIGAVTPIGTDNNTPAWAVSITANNVDDAIHIEATGEATVRWVGRVELVEVGSP